MRLSNPNKKALAPQLTEPSPSYDLERFQGSLSSLNTNRSIGGIKEIIDDMYVETQMYGELTLDDVEAIEVVSHELAESLRKTLRTKGYENISVTIIDGLLN